MPFDTLPSGASIKCEPFKAHVSDEELQDFKNCLRYSRIGPKTYENQVSDVKDFNSYGITRQWLSDTVEYWRTKYDWRKLEDRINALPMWKTKIEHNGDTFDVHFVGLFSKKPDAVPLLVLHGWPGSFLEFTGALEELSKKYNEDSLPFHIVTPSLLGYGYSSGPPLDKDFIIEDLATVMDKLMRGLGFSSGYIAQGGDLGSYVARVIGVKSDACKAVHLNLAIGVGPESDEEAKSLDKREQEAMKRIKDFSTLGNAYARHHGTRPSTIGLVLSSSPVALLSWIGEKYQQWTEDTPPVDEILDSTTLYWFTSTFPRAIYPYREPFGPNPTFFHPEAKWYIKKPMGYSWHPKELAPVPTKLVAKTGNLVWSKDHDEGGHFAAWEKPKLFVQDMESFCQDVWPKAKGS